MRAPMLVLLALFLPASSVQADEPEGASAPSDGPVDTSADLLAGSAPPEAGAPATGSAPVTPAASPTTAPMQFVGDGSAFLPQRRGVQLDFQVEGGAGFAIRNELPHAPFLRARLGMLIVREPWILAFGPTFELGGMAGLGVGGQLDFIHLASGWSVELGAAYAVRDRAVFSASLGYAIFGIEWQHLFAEQDADAILFKVRIPVGVFLFLLNHR